MADAEGDASEREQNHAGRIQNELVTRKSKRESRLRDDHQHRLLERVFIVPQVDLEPPTASK